MVLLLLLSGCHAWPSRPVSEIGGLAGRTIRVVTDNGTRRAVLQGAAVVGDSVSGRVTALDTLRADGWAPLRGARGERMAIPASAITRVEVWELDKRTYSALLVIGMAAFAAALLGLLWVAALAGSD
jgi:hypothetical protein